MARLPRGAAEDTKTLYLLYYNEDKGKRPLAAAEGLSSLLLAPLLLRAAPFGNKEGKTFGDEEWPQALLAWVVLRAGA